MKKINKCYTCTDNGDDNCDSHLVSSFYTLRDNDRSENLFKIWTPGSDKLPPWPIRKEESPIYC